MVEIERVFSMLESRAIAPISVVVVAEVGSSAHGMTASDYDDLDLAVVRFEPLEELVNGPSSRQAMMVRSQPEGRRSGPGDIDLQVLTVRRFAKLALAGNPSILNVLFTPHVHSESDSWADLRLALRRTAISKRAGQAFLGYLQQQKERWQGTRGGKRVNRPELVERFGFDTKYAAHAIRLGYQGTAFMLTGEVPIPLPPQQRETLVRLRTGAFTEAEALALADEAESLLLGAIERSPLPDRANVEELDREITRLYGDWLAGRSHDVLELASSERHALPGSAVVDDPDK